MWNIVNECRKYRLSVESFGHILTDLLSICYSIRSEIKSPFNSQDMDILYNDIKDKY